MQAVWSRDVWIFALMRQCVRPETFWLGSEIRRREACDTIGR